MLVNFINYLIKIGNKYLPKFKDEFVSDGYHTFKDMYDIRLAYNVALFNTWGEITVSSENYPFTGEDRPSLLPQYDVHKSWRHHDGQGCFGEEKKWFIVSAYLPGVGLISNHYKAEHWDLFKIPEVRKALYEFDGHTTKDVIERLKNSW